MAVTWNAGRTVATMTAANDQIDERLYINKISVTGMTTAAHTAVVRSYPYGAGDEIFKGVAATTNDSAVEYFEDMMVRGLKLQTLASGTVKVTIS